MFENGRSKDHQQFSGDFVGKCQKFLLFSNNHNQLFENGKKQNINNFVGTLLENGRNFGRFPTTQNVSAIFQERGFGRFPTIFSAVFHMPPRSTIPALISYPEI